MSAKDRARPGWAVIGTGDVSGYVSSDLALLEVTRVGVLSRELAKAEAFAAKYGFERSYADLRDLLADPEVEVVYIATPHVTHAAIAIRALAAGKHVLIEKPLAVDAAEGEQIAEAAAASGTFAMEAMWMKFSPTYRAVLAEVSAGSVGTVRSVRASFGLPFGAPDSPRWSRERVSSNILDQAIYPVTLAVDALGEPTAIHAIGTVRDDGVDLAAHITFEYPGGQFAQLSTSMVEYLEPNASIHGTAGWLTIAAPFMAAARYERHAGTIPDALFRPVVLEHPLTGFGYVPMLEAVNTAILAGQVQHDLHPLAESIRILELLDRTRKMVLAADAGQAGR